MDSMDAATKLQGEFDVRWPDARSAVEYEAKYLMEDNPRLKYPDAIDSAYDSVRGWILDADQFQVKLAWDDIASFSAGRRAACLWAVLVGKAIAAKKATTVQP